MYELPVNAPFLRTEKKIFGTGGIAFVLSIDFEHRIALVAQMVNIKAWQSPVTDAVWSDRTRPDSLLRDRCISVPENWDDDRDAQFAALARKAASRIAAKGGLECWRRC
jgi:hypothetical protein